MLVICAPQHHHLERRGNERCVARGGRAYFGTAGMDTEGGGGHIVWNSGVDTLFGTAGVEGESEGVGGYEGVSSLTATNLVI